MSGIAGVFYTDNRPVLQSQLRAMAQTLNHRGPDGITYFCDGPLGLIHLMRHDTPESLFEKQPTTTIYTRLVITFHGRIDNRLELISKTGWKRPPHQTADSDLILAAYQKWGTGCSERLLGDFAFAIWDSDEKTMYCARDRMGVIPFYYYHSENCFAFASEPKAILSLPGIPSTLNKERVADFLTCVVADKESSFFKDILRLSPGYFIEVSNRKKRVCKYYELQPTMSGIKRSEEYQEQFKEIFTEAVRCRLRSALPIGYYLSGGLDSSSIVCCAAEISKPEGDTPIQTFSGIFDEVKECDERKYFNHILEKYPIQPHYVHADRLSPQDAYDELIQISDEPPFSPHFFVKWNLSRKAQKAGVRVVLDGHDGDSAVSYGSGLFSELARQGRILQMIREYRNYDSFTSGQLLRKVVNVYRNIAYNRWPWLNAGRNKKELDNLLSILHPDFVANTKIRERLVQRSHNLRNSGHVEGEQHLLNLNDPLQPYAVEFLEKLGTSFGLSIRFPYFDQRLIEFCLSLPAEEKFSMGYNRAIVRRSLKQWMPSQISQRKQKTYFTASLLHAFSKVEKEWIELTLDNIDEKSYNYYDKQYLYESIKKYKNSKDIQSVVALYPLIRAVSLVKWLDAKKLVV